jgi:prepilin-type N-terminal cleavage/methylation domain-containing protein
MTLIEKMVVVAIIGILAAITLPTVAKSFKNARAWIWGAYALHENRLNAVMDDKDKLAELFLVQKVHKWDTVSVQ